MRISEFAHSLGLSPVTIRYYERRGLLGATQRTPNGYRSYGPADVNRVAYILRARQLGFSLSEIHGLLQASDSPHEGCQEVWRRMDGKLRELRDTVERLQRQCDRLQHHLDIHKDMRSCTPPPGGGCELIGAFDPGGDWPRAAAADEADS